MRLYQIPRQSKIYNLWPNGKKDEVVVFDHIDGMYSYCYLESDSDQLLHLSGDTLLLPYKDGYELAPHSFSENKPTIPEP